MFFNNPVACLALPTISELLRGFQKLRTLLQGPLPHSSLIQKEHG